jgi:hypothetical protein
MGSNIGYSPPKKNLIYFRRIDRFPRYQASGIQGLIIDLLPPYSSRMLWTFPTYSMPDIAFFTFILTVSSRQKARESGKIAADAITSLDG